MKRILVFCAISSILAQDNREDAINSLFSNTTSGFLDDYEEVTSPPLKGFGVLPKCGEAAQLNRFVCVPYFNCNAGTNTVEVNPDVDGANRINIRMNEGEESRCEHYLEVCCALPNDTSVVNPPTSESSSENTDRIDTTRPPNAGTSANKSETGTSTGTNGQTAKTSVNCGIRNAAGLDFNLIGGTNEANFGEFPWMLAVLRKNPQDGQTLAICGASLIGPRVALTGAHCVHTVNINDIKIRAGEWDTQTENERLPFQERNVVQKILHEGFIPGNVYNDVALLILDRPLTKTDSIGTICLPNQAQHFNSRECLATGWGKDIFGQEGRYAVILKKLQLPLVQSKDCQQSLRKTRLGNNFILHRSFICAGGEPNQDTCTGDGGSPLVCPDPNNPGRYLQVGIVAWGIGCGENQVPGVYVDVANFRTWIDNKLQNVGISTETYTL